MLPPTYGGLWSTMAYLINRKAMATARTLALPLTTTLASTLAPAIAPALAPALALALALALVRPWRPSSRR